MTKWKEFKINELFELKNCKTINTPDLEKYVNKGIPHISRKSDNNGIKGYIKNAPQNKLNKGKCLSIDMFCNVFYRKENYFLACDHLLTLRHNNIDSYNSLFLKKSIELKLQKIFSFSKIVSEISLKNELIELPINIKTNQPHWQLMARYIKILKQKYKPKQLNQNTLKENINLDIKNWQEFNFFDIFNESYKTGNTQVNKSKNGELPLICSGNGKYYNGITAYIGKETKEPFNANSITLSKNGSVGNVFYQPKSFYAVNDIMILQLKDKTLTKNIALFLKVILEKQLKKDYNWGRKITIKEVLPNLKINLPCKDNKIDYDYIENYIDDINKKVFI
jgi:hypothetical protein